MNVCILLAAGSSSRMQMTGQEAVPKMLLPLNGKTLLQHTIDEVKKLDDCKLVVVTGCYHHLLQGVLQEQGIDFAENRQWAEGMGFSIQKGMAHVVQQYPNADNAIILVCDQPYLSASLLQQLISVQHSTQKGIVAASYNDTAGTPVLFNKKYFEQLLSLQGQYGAKKIVQQFAADTTTVPFPEGAVDIDTPADYENVCKP